jgi:hypothetical protein
MILSLLFGKVGDARERRKQSAVLALLGDLSGVVMRFTNE